MYISDIVKRIISYLPTKSKLNLLSISKFHYNLTLVFSDEPIHLNRIIGLPCFNKFTNIIINDTDDIPNNATHLTFINIPNRSKKTLPPKTVTHLSFGKNFNQQIIINSNNVTHLTFGINFNQQITKTIPNSVTHLTFGRKFNQSITNDIPNSVTHLTFGFYFDQPIKKSIPNNVTHLIFGALFNQPIKNAIPNSVIHLTFGLFFNQSIINAIPNSVIQLTFGLFFNQPITFSNIKFVRKLTVPKRYALVITNMIVMSSFLVFYIEDKFDIYC